ncbi:MAG TPA: response regulator transcription factor, partial [Roseimicrobium sp.]|nr:response regulator transcription factor [Roseimicrobium sp.]
KLRQDGRTAPIPFIFLTAKGTKKEQRSGMDLGADDYLVKPVTVSDMLSAIAARLSRQETLFGDGKGHRGPDFSSAKPLESLGLTAREAEVLLWVTQGKSNADVASILNLTENTVKKHLQNVYAKLGLESRNSAALRAIEVLNGVTSTAS